MSCGWGFDNLSSKIELSAKKIVRKMFWSNNYFWSKEVLVLKNFFCSKEFFVQKYFLSRIFWCPKYLVSKNISYPKKLSEKNNVLSKIIENPEIFSGRIFLVKIKWLYLQEFKSS